MSHLSEIEFQEGHVVPWLEHTFPHASLETQKWLPETTCYADVWLDFGLVVIAAEIENDAGSIRSGVAQALEYAANDTRAVPIVITPEGHVDYKQAAALRHICPIIELPVENEYID